jgi:hypothetical protein
MKLELNSYCLSTLDKVTNYYVYRGFPWQWDELRSGCWFEEISEASKHPKELSDTEDLFHCLVGVTNLFYFLQSHFALGASFYY